MVEIHRHEAKQGWANVTKVSMSKLQRHSTRSHTGESRYPEGFLNFILDSGFHRNDDKNKPTISSASCFFQLFTDNSPEFFLINLSNLRHGKFSDQLETLGQLVGRDASFFLEKSA